MKFNSPGYTSLSAFGIFFTLCFSLCIIFFGLFDSQVRKFLGIPEPGDGPEGGHQRDGLSNGPRPSFELAQRRRPAIAPEQVADNGGDEHHRPSNGPRDSVEHSPPGVRTAAVQERQADNGGHQQRDSEPGEPPNELSEGLIWRQEEGPDDSRERLVNAGSRPGQEQGSSSSIAGFDHVEHQQPGGSLET